MKLNKDVLSIIYDCKESMEEYERLQDEKIEKNKKKVIKELKAYRVLHLTNRCYYKSGFSFSFPVKEWYNDLAIINSGCIHSRDFIEKNSYTNIKISYFKDYKCEFINDTIYKAIRQKQAKQTELMSEWAPFM